MKKGTVLAIILFLFLIAAGSMTAYYLTSNKEKDQENEVNDKSEVKEDLKVSDSEIDELMKRIDDLSLLMEEGEDDLSLKDLSNQRLLHASVRLTKTNSESYFVNEYDFDALNETAKKYFGCELKKEDYICPMDETVLFNYEEDSNKLVYNEDHLGHGVGTMPVFNIYQEASKDDDLYTIKVKKAFVGYDETPLVADTDVYKTAKEAKYLVEGTPVLQLKIQDGKFEISEEEVLNEAKKIKDELNTYTYKFKKVGSNFEFISYKLD